MRRIARGGSSRRWLHGACLAAVLGLSGCGQPTLPAAPPGADQSAGATPPATRTLPMDLHGTWIVAGEDDRLQGTGDKPPFTPAGRKLFEAHRAAAARGDRSWDGTHRCLPPGVPRVLAIAQPFAIAIDEHLLLMTFQLQRLVRLVYLDDAFPAAGKPSYLGESHGRWDGNALLIETQNFKPGLVLDGTGLPAGTHLKLAERLELADDGVLVDHLTISDDEMYTRPWQAELRFRHSELPLREDVCVERIGRHT